MQLLEARHDPGDARRRKAVAADEHFLAVEPPNPLCVSTRDALDRLTGAVVVGLMTVDFRPADTDHGRQVSRVADQSIVVFGGDEDDARFGGLSAGAGQR